MKFKLLLLSAVFSGLGLTSCNLDSDDSDQQLSYQLTCANFVTSVEGEAFATSATYNLTFFYVPGTLSINTSNLVLGLGNTNGFTTDKMPFTTEGNFNKFSGGKASDNGLTISNLSGYTTSDLYNLEGADKEIITGFNWNSSITPLVMSYNANYDYTVKTFLPDAIYRGVTSVAAIEAPGMTYQGDATKYRVIFTDDYKKATVIFYGAKFNERMPEITFMLKDLAVTWINDGAKRGYSIDGTNIIPYQYEAKAWDPNEGFPFLTFNFTNTSSDLTGAAASYTLKVKTMGDMTFTNTFTGSYIKTEDK